MATVKALASRARSTFTAFRCFPLTLVPPSSSSPSSSFPASACIATTARPSIVHTHRWVSKSRANHRSTPYAAQFHLPSTLSVRTLYRALLRAAALFPDDLVRWYLAQRCRDEWRQHRAQHREKYQAELLARYEKQKARLQVRERVQRIQAGESDEAATDAALDLSFDTLRLPPLQQLRITKDVYDIPLDLRRTIHERYKAAKAQLDLLHAALHHSASPATISSRTEVLCAAYGWQGGATLDRLTHLRAMYINAPNMLQPHTLHSLHPLHRYLITGIHTNSHHPPTTQLTTRRPAVGVYEWWPVKESDRLRSGALVSGVRWMECYRLLIMERVQGLDSGWRRAYSDMLRQRQIVGQVGQQEQAGVKITRAGMRRKKNGKAADDGWEAADVDEKDDDEDEHKKRRY